MIKPLKGKALDSYTNCDAFINLWEGSVRSGKTVASIIAFLKFVRTSPAGDLLMVGKTERTLERNIINPLKDMLGSQRVKYNSGKGELFISGRLIYVAGANDAKAESKIRGMTLVGSYVDEVSLLPESMFAQLVNRHSLKGARIYGTTNPDNPNHWLMRDYLSKARLTITHTGETIQNPDGINLHRFSFNLDDNPTLEPDYIQNLKQMYTGLFYKRFIQGLWVLAEGAIYDTFDNNNIANQPTTPITEWSIAVDYGTTNPLCALLIGTGDNLIYVASEYWWDSKETKQQKTDSEYSTALREWLQQQEKHWTGAHNYHTINIDPSAASFQAQLHRDHWHGIRNADNTVIDGIRETSNLIANKKLQINPSCKNLIRETQSYVWDPTASLKGEEKPLKTNDHAVDALRYGVRSTRTIWRKWHPHPS